MKRRALLATIGAGTVPAAGCTGVRAPEAGDAVTETPTAEDREKRLRISSVDAVPADAPLVPTVEVIQPAITPDRLARVRVSLANTAGSAVWNSNVRIRAFDRFITQAGPNEQQLVLLDPTERYPTVSAGCWRVDLDDLELNFAYTDVVTDVRYSAGETRVAVFDVYGHPENTGPCLPPGEYRIESTYRISMDEKTDSIDWTYDWGFTIEIVDS
ncbi:MAG: hypothetical protein ABEH81_14860 [Halopenitus sp.]